VFQKLHVEFKTTQDPDIKFLTF